MEKTNNDETKDKSILDVDPTEDISEEKEQSSPPHSYAGEDRIERSSLSLKEKMRAERAILESNMEGMDKKERFKYLLYYHKWYLVMAGIALILICMFTWSAIDSRKPQVLYMDILNCNMGSDVNISVLKEHYDSIYGKNYKMRLYYSDTIGLEHKKQYPTASSYASFPAACAANMYDVVITDKDGLDWCTANSSIYAPVSVLSEETMKMIADDLVSAYDKNGNLVDAAVNISDTEFAKSLNLPYDKIYLCFPGNNEENLYNAENLLNFIYNKQ